MYLTISKKVIKMLKYFSNPTQPSLWLNPSHVHLCCAACSRAEGRHNMPPPPASGDLNSHSEPSAWRSPHMSMMRVFVLHPCIPSLKFLGFPFRRYGWFSVTALSCLLTLTFDLLTSKLGYGLPVSLASFPPIFSLARKEQTYRRTDNAHQCIMHPSMGVRT